MTIYWIGCGLASLGMHCHAMAHAARSAAAKLHVELRILAPLNAADRVLHSLGARPELTRSVYGTDLARLNDPAAFQRELLARREDFRSDLERCLSALIGSTDTVVLVTPMAPELAALADWCASVVPERRPRLAAYCVLPTGYGLSAGSDWQHAAMTDRYEESLRRLVSMTNGSFVLLCESRQVMRDLSRFVPAAILQPHVFEMPSSTRPRGRPGVPYVLMIGALYRSRTDKGIDLVLEILRSPAARQVPFDWVVQVAPMHRQPPAGCQGENIRFILGVPGHDEYWDYLTGASLVLLPYDPESYGDGRGSGVFEEALAAGVPVLCSEAPFFVESLRALGVPELLFNPYSAESLFRKTCDLMANIDRHHAIFGTIGRERRGTDAAVGVLQRLIGSR